MSITTYGELQTAVNDWLEDSELSGHVTTFIQLAEARHQTEIRIREMETRETLTLAAGSDADTDRFLALSGLSSTFLDLKYLRLKVPSTSGGSSYYPPLEQVTHDEMTRHARKDAGTPCAFSIWNEQIVFDRMADVAYTVEVLFYSPVTPLSDSNTTNALLTRSPGVYLFSSLAEAAPFLMHDERIDVWEQKYQTLRDQLNKSERDQGRAGPLVPKVRGLPPR